MPDDTRKSIKKKSLIKSAVKEAMSGQISLQVVDDKTDSVELTKNANGSVSWKIKCYGKDGKESLTKVEKIVMDVEKLAGKYDTKS